MPFFTRISAAFNQNNTASDSGDVPLLNGGLKEYDAAFRKEAEASAAAFKKRNRLYQTWQFVTEDMKAEVHTGAMDRLRNLQNALEKLDRVAYDRPRPIMHRKIHRMFTQGALQRIFGAEYEAYLPELIEMFGDVPNPHIIVTLPRRHGKTVATAWWAAAFMWTQPNARLCAFSVAKRTTEMFALKVQQFLMMVGGDGLIFKEHNKETTSIINMYGDAGGVSIGKFYPSRQDIECVDRCLSVNCLFCSKSKYNSLFCGKVGNDDEKVSTNPVRTVALMTKK